MERKDIDYYIEKANNMKPTDHSPRAGTNGYRIDDVILLKYGIYRKNEELQKEINEAVERGAQTPRYLAVKEDKDNYWILQEVAKGRNDIPNEDVGDYFTDLIKAPDEQYKNLLITIKELFDFDLEIRTTNIFYDKDIGFTVIDIGKSPEKFFNEHNINDISSLISDADTAISSLYYFASFCGEIMPPQNQFERKFITYRLLKVVREFISNIDIEMLDKLKFEYSDNEEIFDIFEARIKELDEITPQKLEDLVNLIFEQYPKNKIILRN